MTFEEAKQRSDYRFDADNLEKYYIEEIRNNHMEDMDANSQTVMGCAVLEIGYVDIELNIATYAMVEDNADENDNRPILDYFCCVKVDNEEWESDGYLDYNIRVDWKADNWKEQLEREMFEVLDRYTKKKNYSYDEPNHIIDEYNTIEALLKRLKDLGETYEDIELYESNSRGRYYPNHFHTDNCRCIEPNVPFDQYSRCTEVGFYELMDEEEYNDTILANTIIHADFDDWYGNKDAKVLCIMVK